MQTPPPPLVYRKLWPGESGLYRALRLECLRRYPDHFAATYEEEAQDPKLPFEAAIEEGRADRFVVGAFAGKRLVGIACFDRLEPRRKNHRGEVRHVYVDPDRQGRAIGSSLMRALLGMAFALPGIELVELKVVTGNAPALCLYSSLGFEKFELQENFFGEGGEYWHQYFMQITRPKYLALRYGAGEALAPLRQAAGGTPNSRLNARLNAASDS